MPTPDPKQQLRRAQETIQLIQPLPPDSTPTTKKTFRKLIHKLHESTKDILSHIGTIVETSHLSDGEPDSETEDEDQVSLRFQANHLPDTIPKVQPEDPFLSIIERDRVKITVVQLRDRLFDCRTGSQEARENEGLYRLISGYEVLDELVRISSGHIGPS